MSNVTRRAKTTDLTPDARNANKGTPRGLAMLDDSLRKYGAGRSILVDKNGKVLAGNKTLERAVDVGIDDVLIVPSDGKQLVAVQRTDIDIDTPAGRALAIADNRVAEIDLDWDAEALAALAAEGVNLEEWWNEGELAILLDGSDESPGDPGAALDRATEWRKKWSVEKGQLWSFGRHRLLCGSAYNAADLDRLIDGKKPDMLHIDPPYGIGIVKPENAAESGQTNGRKPLAPGFARGATAAKTTDSAERTIGATHRASRTALIIQPNEYAVIEGDDTPFDPALFVDYAPVVVMWGANYYADKLPVSSCWICWDKREDITRNDFADGELAWTNQDKPMRIFHHLWNGLHKGSQYGERRLHPTEIPVALFEGIGCLFADKGLWLDLFAGSGPQLVAAERTGATCYAMEIEPLYVATIIERLSEMGLKPERIP